MQSAVYVVLLGFVRVIASVFLPVDLYDMVARMFALFNLSHHDSARDILPIPDIVCFISAVRPIIISGYPTHYVPLQS